MKHDVGPAFPRTQWTGSDRNSAHRDVPGMSLHAHYAGQAMQAIIAGRNDDWSIEDRADDIAYLAGVQADAMLGEANYRDRLELDREEAVKALKEISNRDTATIDSRDWIRERARTTLDNIKSREVE